MRDIRIGKRTCGPSHKPIVIAEMSGNHNHSLERALTIVDAAAASGADGLKLQTYTADTMTIDVREREFVITDPKSLWHGKSLYDLYKEAYTPWEWHKPIKERCDKHGMFFLSTPFDHTAVDFLETLDVPIYKVASFEAQDVHLIRKIAKTGKPIIISTGMASPADLYDMVDTARSAGCQDLILLKCTSNYPATPVNTNLSTIPHLRDMFGTQVGLSDHTMGVGCSVAAVALGATLIEKHFTLRRADGGVDSAFSLEPEEMKSLVIETERAWQGIGKVTYGTASEEGSKQFRRSIYITEALKAGDVLTTKNTRCIRPGMGLPPKFLDTVLGKRVRKDVPRGTAVSWDLIG